MMARKKADEKDDWTFMNASILMKNKGDRWTIVIQKIDQIGKLTRQQLREMMKETDDV